MAATLKNLKAMTEADLIQEHDKVAASTQVGVNYYLEELRTREMSKYAEKMDKLTRGIFWMTFVVTAATCVNVVVFVWERLI